ncbi:hypothetical protein [Sciscionella marina]|uniref:hypothetical protein n=1 Tax=Sciscionella marina TaxID=508770 RepID=UPI0012F6551B|nr:hypothetical protein [Sciscionella marina]
MPGSSGNRARGTSQPWLFAAVLFAVVVALAAGLLTRGWYVLPTRVATPITPSEPSPSKNGAAPGSPVVSMSTDAAAHPDGARVRDALQTYFNSINEGSYTDWLRAVTTDRAEDKTRAQWKQEYRSTKDGSITVYRIERVGPGSLRVLLSFTSAQNPRDAPADFPHQCIRWRVVYPFALERGEWKLDSGQAGASPQHDQC